MAGTILKEAFARQRAFLFLALVPSVAVGMWSLRYGFIAPDAAPPGIRDVMRAAPWLFGIHALGSALALIVGPFQFLVELRRKAPAVHRLIGRLYVAACIAGGLGALSIVPIASGGIAASIGFGLLAVLWIGTTGAALLAALRRDFDLHRRLMLYSFAMTFAAVTLRLQIPLMIVVFGAEDYPEASRVLAWSSWLPNVLCIWWWLRRKGRLVPGSVPT